MLVAFGGSLVMRPKVAHDAPAPPAENGQVSGAPGASAALDGGAEASASGASSGASGSAASSSGAVTPGVASGAPSADGGPPIAADAGPVKLLDRPLRVVAIGWDLIAPGLLANGGLVPGASSEFSAAGLDVHLAPVDSMQAVEGAMARGGADKDGADVAIVSMPAFVASYERLRALSPEAFFVVGFSRGREAIVGSKEALPSGPLKTEVHLAATPGDAASFVGLFVLDASGIAPTGVQFLPPTARVDEAPLAAVDRGSTDPAASGRRNLLVTTADMPRLVPFVAVSTRGMLEKNGRALSAWARVWLSGTQRLSQDAPAGARQVAAAQGAPDPLSLLRRLGEMAPATLGDNVRITGLSGRGALTLDALFDRTWYLWRTAGVLATPEPESVPISSAVIAAIARQSPALVDPPISRAAGSESSTKKQDANLAKAKTLFVHRAPDGALDEEAFVGTAGFFAAVFERSPIRVSVQPSGAFDAAKTKKLIERVQDRFDIAPGRLVAAKGAIGKGSAALEILSVP